MGIPHLLARAQDVGPPLCGLENHMNLGPEGEPRFSEKGGAYFFRKGNLLPPPFFSKHIPGGGQVQTPPPPQSKVPSPSTNNKDPQKVICFNLKASKT